MTYYDLHDIWSILPVLSDFDLKNKKSYQLGNAFRSMCYKFAGATVVQAF